MVHVILAEVILGEVRDVRLLYMGNIGRAQDSDIHDDGLVALKCTSLLCAMQNVGVRLPSPALENLSRALRYSRDRYIGHLTRSRRSLGIKILNQGQQNAIT